MYTNTTIKDSQVTVNVESHYIDSDRQDLSRKKIYPTIFGGIALVLLILGLALEKFNSPSFGYCLTSTTGGDRLPCNQKLEVVGIVLCITGLVMQVLFAISICFYFPQKCVI